MLMNQFQETLSKEVGRAQSESEESDWEAIVRRTKHLDANESKILRQLNSIKVAPVIRGFSPQSRSAARNSRATCMGARGPLLPSSLAH